MGNVRSSSFASFLLWGVKVWTCAEALRGHGSPARHRGEAGGDHKRLQPRCQLGNLQDVSSSAGEEREGGREGGKVNKPIKDALSRVERRRGEGGSGQTVPRLVGRLPAALQRDRELSGVLRERRGARRKGGLKETERGGVEEQLSSHRTEEGGCSGPGDGSLQGTKTKSHLRDEDGIKLGLIWSSIFSFTAGDPGRMVDLRSRDGEHRRQRAGEPLPPTCNLQTPGGLHAPGQSWWTEGGGSGGGGGAGGGEAGPEKWWRVVV
ncbi:unnamed protein product [Pleuronectes platessa]|uniref:Uncharacterized protein n=1 Tax=Pleuronectes platessa TaxID=8262 RepID=A0A9N7W2V5_PLEPL|nr:unnamed protein product [Pleuronectes platessa]